MVLTPNTSSLFTLTSYFKFLPMAQLDNAADSDSEERGFKSLWAGQNENPFSQEDGFLFCIIQKNAYPISHTQ